MTDNICDDLFTPIPFAVHLPISAKFGKTLEDLQGSGGLSATIWRVLEDNHGHVLPNLFQSGGDLSNNS